MLPEHHNKLFTNEALSSIALSRDIANKLNELIDAYNELNQTDLQWKHKVEGEVHAGVVYMKDNLLNSLNELMVLLRDSGFIDDRIEYHCDYLKERLDNLLEQVENNTSESDGLLLLRDDVFITLFNKPEFYGAIGDGEHNDSEAMQKALDTTGCLYLSKGKRYLGDVTVKNPNSVITGGGTLLGSIVLFAERDENNYPIDGNMVIDSIVIESDIPIVMGMVRGFTITNCLLNGVSNGILFKQTSEFSQIVNKGIISNNRITGKTGIELRELNDDIFGGCADITITHNTIESSERNVLLINVDGCKITSNTLFMNGFSEKLATKKQNIYTQKTNWLTIENNTMFEAGEESIRIETKSRNTLINSNIIGWCGQAKLSSGIYIGSYDTSGKDDYLNIVISNNIITVPTKHGIEFGGYIVGAIVSNNMITGLNNLTYYYGEEDYDSIEHYGLYTLNQDNYDSILFANNVVSNVANNIGTGIINTYNLDAQTNENLIMPSKLLRVPHKVNIVSGGVWYDSVDKKLKYSDGENTYILSIE